MNVRLALALALIAGTTTAPQAAKASTGMITGVSTAVLSTDLNEESDEELLNEDARRELDALLNEPYVQESIQQASAESDRKPAVLGPATAEPHGENAGFYTDQITTR